MALQDIDVLWGGMECAADALVHDDIGVAGSQSETSCFQEAAEQVYHALSTMQTAQVVCKEGLHAWTKRSRSAPRMELVRSLLFGSCALSCLSATGGKACSAKEDTDSLESPPKEDTLPLLAISALAL